MQPGLQMLPACSLGLARPLPLTWPLEKLSVDFLTFGKLKENVILSPKNSTKPDSTVLSWAAEVISVGFFLIRAHHQLCFHSKIVLRMRTNIAFQTFSLCPRLQHHSRLRLRWAVRAVVALSPRAWERSMKIYSGTPWWRPHLLENSLLIPPINNTNPLDLSRQL